MSSQLESLTLISKDSSKLNFEPKFKKSTTEYTCLLPSSIDELQIDCFTLDADASYKVYLDNVAQNESRAFIKFSANEKKQIKVQVENAAGSEKTDYIINATKLSKSTALMVDFCLQIEKKKSFKKAGNCLEIKPDFSPDVTNYTCQLDNFKLESLIIRTKFADSETKCSFSDGEPVQLSPAITNLSIKVTSPDDTNVKTYSFTISRSGPAVYIKPKNDKVECFLSKSLAFPPLKIGAKVYNQAFFETLTRFNRVDPFSTAQLTLAENWHTPTNEDLKLLDENANFQEILSEIEKKFSPEDKNESDICSQEILSSDWHKKLSSENFSMPSEVGKIIEDCKIKQLIQKHARNAHPEDKIEELKSAEKVDFERLINCCCKNENYLELGQAIELKNYKAWLGGDASGATSGSKRGNTSSRAEAGLKIKMSGWEDDIKCVCELHGFGKSSDLKQQLQALDKELQSLKEQNADHTKMDHVRELYAYKQKQAVDRAERKGEAQEADKEAYASYFLALNIGTGFEKFENLFFAGRALFKLGFKESAIYLLRNSLCKSPKNKDARLYLALADAGNFTSWKESSIKIHEKYLLQPLFNKISKKEFLENFGVFSYNLDLYRTDLWACYPEFDSRLLYILWNFIKSLNTSSSAYQKTAWKLLETSRAANFSDEYLKILSKSFKFSDLGRISKFNLEIEGQALKKDPRNVDILINYGKYCYEIAQDEDDTNLVGKFCGDAEVCFRSAIKFEKKDTGEGDCPELAILKETATCSAAGTVQQPRAVPAVGANATGKTQAGSKGVGVAGASKPPAKLPLKVANKPAAKPAAGKGKPAAKPAVKAVSAGKSAGKGAVAATAATGKPAATAAGGKKTGKINPERPISRLWLAKVYKLKLDHGDSNKDLKIETIDLYKDCLKLLPKNLEANIDLARLSVVDEPLLAVDHYQNCLSLDSALAANEDGKMEICQLADSDKSFISSEIVNILLKLKKLDDPRLEENMILWAKTYGLAMLDKAVKLMEDNNKTFILRRVYCAVHGKSEDDAELKQFFNFKCW